MSDTHTFYWHDYETFGRVPRRDRPAQFAGVRTDADLNEIGEPTMVYCQPAPDYLPDPESCLLTGILPQTCLAEGVPEHRFASIIEAELALPGTVGVGYNSIRFDDEVTRHLFWRNLIDPYAREWQNQCGRWDILDVVRATYALRPDGIQWPKHDDGRPSFKLEHLTKANGLAHQFVGEVPRLGGRQFTRMQGPERFGPSREGRRVEPQVAGGAQHAERPEVHVVRAEADADEPVAVGVQPPREQWAHRGGREPVLAVARAQVERSAVERQQQGGVEAGRFGADVAAGEHEPVVEQVHLVRCAARVLAEGHGRR